MKVSPGLVAALLTAVSCCAQGQLSLAGIGVAPPEVASIPVSPLPGDSRIDLEIRTAIAAAQQTLANPSSTPADKEKAQAVLAERILVIFDFSAQITVSDLIAFVDNGGGEVTYIYRFSYGWNGIIARGRIPEVASALSAGFRAVVPSRPISIDPPPFAPVEIVQVPAAVSSATEVIGPFTVETALVDAQLQTVTLQVKDEPARFFRLSSYTPLVLVNPSLKGDTLTFSYRIAD